MGDVWLIKVVNSDSGEVVKTLQANSERAADRIDDGININLNHEKFHTVVEKQEKAQ